MHQHVVAQSLNGKQVYAYLIQPPLSARLSRNPHLLTLIKEVASQAELNGPTVVLEHNMGRTVGHSDVVELNAGDTVFYARLAREEAYTKFVKNRPTVATTYITMSLVRDDEGDYEIKDVWIGKIVPPPSDKQAASAKCEAFWKDHAVVYNGQPLIASTVTKDPPAISQEIDAE